MFDLRQLGIGITVIDQSIEKLHRFPDPHVALILAQVLALFRLTKSSD